MSASTRPSAGAEPTITGSTIDATRVKAQLRVWQQQLLDLTKANPLLGLNRSRVSKLHVLNPPAEALWTRFAVGDTALRLPLVTRRVTDALEPEADAAAGVADSRDTAANAQPDYTVQPGDVSFEGQPVDLFRRIRRIYDNGRTTVAERGVTTLYLTFGVLAWTEPALGESRSPLLMVPCQLEQSSPNLPLKLSRADEEIEINPALELYLRDRHQVALPALPDVLGADALRAFLDGVREAVRAQGWTVSDEVWLSTYTFEALVIYKDLAAMAELATQHPIVAALARATPLREANESLGDQDEPPPGAPELIPVLETDSSQLRALRRAAAGRDLVVHGPPGTGKSQTISNLIADALGRGQKVLFVSAKMAALEVVHGRLAERGLARFCLEAHSTKAGKTKIIDELKRTLNAEADHDGAAFGEQLEDLQRLRAELNSYVNELHAVRAPLGRTLHQALGRLLQLSTTPEVRGPLPWSSPLDVTRAELNEALDILADLGTQAPVYDSRASHPWRGLSIDGPRVVQEQIEDALATVASAAGTIEHQLDELRAVVGRPRSGVSLERLRSLTPALETVSACEGLPARWAERPIEDLTTAATNFELATTLAIELADRMGRLATVAVGGASGVAAALAPAATTYRRWTRVLQPAYWRWQSSLSSVLLPSASRSKTALLADLGLARRIVELDGWFAEHGAALAAELPEGKRREARALSEAAKGFRASAALRTATAMTGLEGASASVPVTSDLRAASHALALSTGDEHLAGAIGKLDEWWPRGFVDGERASTAPLEGLAARVRQALDHPTELHDWIVVQHVLARCAERNLRAFVEALGGVSARDARNALERRFLSQWAQAVIDSSASLRVATGVRREEQIERFRRLDQDLRLASLGKIKTGASQPADQVRRAGSSVNLSEVAILRREMEKRRNIRPLRKLFADIPHALQALKPCMLMSPLSVSTFLKPGSMTFDLVVFDEASQLPTQEAIPAILRAKQVVVAGDANQLPPSSFFSAGAISDTDGEDEETAESLRPLESLLNDCVAVYPVFESADLRWHYRSRDERLIAFSNHYFYDNHLITFPASSTATDDRGVRLVYVPEGTWDRGRSRTNRQEAQRVASLVVEQLERFPERSVGVVAMNTTQREAIDDCLSDLTTDRGDLQAMLDREREREPFFVKSLENVQGDERDTMIISVGYARTLSGALSMNFGPLNMEGGWRRLNVLVTRAKWQTILVTSMRSHELSGVNPNNRGAVALRNFIAYAERSGQLPAEEVVVTDGATNDFEDAVAAALRDRGLNVDQQVGVSAYRIDMAIRDPRDRSRYVLGIECDGATYHSARSARDRDVLRQQVLRGQGWRLHRLWSTDWWRDPARSIDAALRSLEQAQQAPVEQSVPAPALTDTATVVPPAALGPREDSTAGPSRFPATPYERFRPDERLWRHRDVLIDPSQSRALATSIVALMKAEAPIHEDVLWDRLKEIHGVARAGANVRANITKAIRIATKDSVVRGSDRRFYYYGVAPPTAFRIAADGVHRTIDQIPPEEIQLAIQHLAEEQFGVSREDVPHGVAALFGVERARGDAATTIRILTDDLIQRGLLRLSGLMVYLP